MSRALTPAPNDLLALSAAIRRLRTMRGVSQEQLSLEAGLHRNYAGRVERGELSPTFEPLVSLARALEVSPDELMRLYLLELR
jgi:transcriptional regulator with XRE-family HTH domain